MNTPYFEELYKKKTLFYKIIWSILTIQGFFFTGVVFINPEIVQEAKSTNASTESILTFGALILSILSYSVRKVFLSDKKVAGIINEQIHPEDLVKLTQYHGNSKQIMAKVETLTEYEKRAINLTHYAFIPNLISWIMNEAILLFGVVIAFSFNDPYKVIPFALSQLTLNILMFPNIEELLVRAKRYFKPS